MISGDRSVGTMNNMFGLAWYIVLVALWCLPAVAVAVALVAALLVGSVRRRWQPSMVAAALEHGVEEPLVMSGS